MPRKEVAANTKMPVKTLRALRASIAHWKRMRDGKDRANESPNGSSCALCLRYRNNASCLDKDGNVCPLGRKFGECSYFNRKNPYWVAYNSWFKWHESTEEGLSAWIRAANRMIKALESLLPVKESKARRRG
jgi:hypothetical protein